MKALIPAFGTVALSYVEPFRIGSGHTTQSWFFRARASLNSNPESEYQSAILTIASPRLPLQQFFDVFGFPLVNATIFAST